MTKGKRRWLGLAASVLVLLLIFYNVTRSPEWKEFEWGKFWASLAHARASYLLAALLVTYLSYWIRSYRWKFFVNHLKDASVWRIFVATMVGFSSIYLIGRAGEFVRPAYIARKEKLPFTAMMAVWVLERVYDMVFLVLSFALALLLDPPTPRGRHGQLVMEKLQQGGVILLLGTGAMIVALVLFRLYTAPLTSFLLRVFGFLSQGLRRHLEHFLHSFAAGLEVIRSWKDLLASVAVSALLWLSILAMYWLVLASMGGELRQISFIASAIVLLFAAVGLVVQIPGIGGGFQVGIILVLTEVFNIRAEAAAGAAILLWVMLMVPCVALGLIFLLHEGMTLRKLQAIAEAEELAATAPKA